MWTLSKAQLGFGAAKSIPNRFSLPLRRGMMRVPGEPVWAEPEELKEKIRRKYAGLSPEEKELPEKLMRDAGKKE